MMRWEMDKVDSDMFDICTYIYQVVAEMKTALTNLTKTNSTDHLHEMSPEAQKSVKSIANVNLFR